MGHFIEIKIGIRDNQNIFYEKNWRDDFSSILISVSEIKAVSYWLDDFNHDPDLKLCLINMKDGDVYYTQLTYSEVIGKLVK